jgi:cyanate permease
MGFLKDQTGNFDSGLLHIAVVCNIAAFATMCIHHDKELEQQPIVDNTAPELGNVAEIV